MADIARTVVVAAVLVKTPVERAAVGRYRLAPVDTSAFERAGRARVERYRASPDPSATAILSTFFGEIVEPRRVMVPVASIVAAVAELGMSERLVRTSLSRLVADGLLETRRLGRNSAYGVASGAREPFRAVRRRIFAPQRAAWDGEWIVVVVDPSEGLPEERAAVRTELRWLGLASLGPNVLVSPLVDEVDVVGTLERHHATGVVVLRARTVGGAPVTDQMLASRALPVAELAMGHERCLEDLGPLAQADGAALPATALALRLLLVSQYRRLVLADPGLPAELLPADWPGLRTRQLVADLFSRLLEPSEVRLAEVCPASDGPLPPPPPDTGFAAATPAHT